MKVEQDSDVASPTNLNWIRGRTFCVVDILNMSSMTMFVPTRNIFTILLYVLSSRYKLCWIIFLCSSVAFSAQLLFLNVLLQRPLCPCTCSLCDTSTSPPLCKNS